MSADDPLHGLTPTQVRRYARHLSLPEVGPGGQRRLADARVLLVGAGGLGSPAALYLAAAGVGTLGIVDPDRVELSNLQRQIVHGTGAVGRPKVASAADRLRDLNPEVQVEPHPVRLDSSNALELVGAYDLVVDGSDNFATRYLVNDACRLTGRPWVYGAILRWEGQLSLFGAPGGPCYRCLFREPPPPGLIPGCAEAGVVGVLPGIVGSLQALEAIKWILGRREGTVAGRLLIFDALSLGFREIRLRRDPACPLCGDAPTITALMDYEHFCATGETRPAGGAEVEGGSTGPQVPQLEPEELRAMLDGPAPPALLDVREGWEWAVSNLEGRGARHIPLADLPDRLGELSAPDGVVVYCRSGARSHRAARILLRAGLFPVWNLADGLEGWARTVDPHLPVA
ncbi:MAG: molybdopterin-synthase adenylyltransferase MoeB [Gemmatimonadales bacterium]|nr:MAG: molybdopterin-synthase adenylyltransferase MoeB [Gemmatimonadales bacterium]